MTLALHPFHGFRCAPPAASDSAPPGRSCAADINGDSLVDVFDLLIFVDHYENPNCQN